MSKAIKITRSVGEDLRRTLAGNLASSYYEAFKELVSNSYDADAENVHISLDNVEDVCTIEDDGDGMDEQGLESFFRIGDSDKIAEPVSRRGRERIGQFGIATILIEFLAKSYELETWRDGKKLIVHEDFGDTTDTLSYDVVDWDEVMHGTRIRMEGLNFNSSERGPFSLSKLKQVLTWEMPEVEGFTQFLNDKLLRREEGEKKPITTSMFDVNLPTAGNVRGEIRCFENKVPDFGMYVYVHGRAVGDPTKIFSSGDIPRMLQGRIIGMVHADGLHPYISFDRSRFQVDNDAVREVLGAVRSELLKVRYDAEDVVQEKKSKKAGEEILGTVESTADHVSKVSLESLESLLRTTRKKAQRRLTKTSSETSSREGSFSFVPVDRDPEVGLGWYDPKTRTAYVNVGFPFFHYTDSRQRESVFQLELLYAASSLIGREITLNEHGEDAERCFNRRDRLLAEMAQRVFDSESLVDTLIRNLPVAVTGGEVSPNRLYSQLEMREIVGIPIRCVKKWDEAGILKPQPEMEGFYLGGDIIDALQRLEGYTPAHLITAELEEGRLTRQGISNMDFQIENWLQRYGDQLDYVENIGNGSAPFFIVRNDERQRFISLYESGLLKSRQRGLALPLPSEYTGGDSSVTSPYVGLSAGCEMLGIEIDEAFSLFDRAIQCGKQIRSKFERGRHLFNLHDLREVYGK